MKLMRKEEPPQPPFSEAGWFRQGLRRSRPDFTGRTIEEAVDERDIVAESAAPPPLTREHMHTAVRAEDIVGEEEDIAKAA